MANLSTTYMGLELKNPLIVGACNLSMETDLAKKMEDAGASAIVFKSLFEEQINLESIQMEEELNEYVERHAEMISLFPGIKHAGPEEHLDKLSRIKEVLGIPVIGSLNCINADTWVEYAIEMEKTGVDALELNFYANPGDFQKTSVDIEEEQIEILKNVKKKISIPISVKLSPFYSNTLQFIGRLDKEGVDAFVLFNRLFQPDINLTKQDHDFPFNLSQPADYRLPLRFAGLLYKEINGSICGNTGIFSGEDMVKMLLAGVDCVQVVSAVYRHKIPHLTQMIEDLASWMDSKGYGKLDDFRGKLSKANIKDPYAYQRAQYVDLLMKPFDLLKKYPQV
ncbi:MAG: dihydroorotate dehydrogenase-like protein [Bacteroidia bacterium]|nr:MAG: dihydroorotate dehydrogenase-like protein [Bacteroidia bacterium]